MVQDNQDTEEAHDRGHHDHSAGEHTGHHEVIFMNMKRTYEEYQDIALTAARRSQDRSDELHQQALRHADDLHAVSVQNMTNANTTHDLLAKSAIRNMDLATDRMWNFDEVSHAAANREVANNAISASIAKHESDHHPAPAA